MPGHHHRAKNAGALALRKIDQRFGFNVFASVRSRWIKAQDVARTAEQSRGNE